MKERRVAEERDDPISGAGNRQAMRDADGRTDGVLGVEPVGNRDQTARREQESG
jgi:hypothetical protein